MNRFVVYLLALGVIVAGAFIGYYSVSASDKPQERSFSITARQYAFDPPIINVNKGDSVKIKLKSLDCIHGFYLEGYDIDAQIRPEFRTVTLKRPSKPNEPPQEVEEITFVANKVGKFRYRCSVTCGSMHPFMLGEMVVGPNRPFRTGIGLAIGLIAALFIIFLKINTQPGTK